MPKNELDTEATVLSCKSLSNVERAFRSCKTVDLDVRPVYHWNENRVRAQVFLCLLAYHPRMAYASGAGPLLFDDHDRAAAQARRRWPVAKATVSPAAQRKAASKRTEDGHPVHSFRTLLTDLATMAQNTVRFGADLDTTVLATPTALQKHAFDLLGVSQSADL